ncbi:Transposable element Tcb1 transposase, partial [Harpegnathos saltator]
LFGRIGVKKPLISKKNQRARLQFAENHKDWTVQDWKKILFSDESKFKFKLFGSSGKQYVRRPVGVRYDCKYQIPTVKHDGGGVMVWRAFSYEGVGLLVEIEGVMDRFVYKDILNKQMLPYAKDNMPPEWIFQHDNDPKHASKIVSQYLSAKKVQ